MSRQSHVDAGRRIAFSMPSSQDALSPTRGGLLFFSRWPSHGAVKTQGVPADSGFLRVFRPLSSQAWCRERVSLTILALRCTWIVLALKYPAGAAGISQCAVTLQTSEWLPIKRKRTSIHHRQSSSRREPDPQEPRARTRGPLKQCSVRPLRRQLNASMLVFPDSSNAWLPL